MSNALSAETLETLRMQQLEDYYADPPRFLRECLPHWFTTKFSWLHLAFIAFILRRADFLSLYPEELKKIYKFCKIRRDPWDKTEAGKSAFVPGPDGKPILRAAPNAELMLPRGMGKTTTENGCFIFLLCFGDRKFILLCSETADQAARQYNNIRTELEDNPILIGLFGQLRGSKDWNEKGLHLQNGSWLAYTSRGGQVRGKNFGGQRPDLIVLDDVEDQESVETPLQRGKTLDWFLSAVQPAISELSGSSSFLLTGTLLDKEALLVTLGTDPSFTTMVFGVLDPDGEPIFPEYMSVEKLQLKKDLYARQGRLAKFYLEYFNQISSDETAIFRAENFLYECSPATPVARAVCVDPALSSKSKADYCSFGVVSLLPGGRLQVEYCDGFRGMRPRETAEKYFQLRRQWNLDSCPCYFGLETVAYQAALADLIRELMATYGDYFPLEELRFQQEKQTRIRGQLEGRYSAHMIQHRVPFKLYESQLLEFPFGHDDLPDVIAMCCHLLAPHIPSAVDSPVDSSVEDVLSYKEITTGGL